MFQKDFMQIVGQLPGNLLNWNWTRSGSVEIEIAKLLCLRGKSFTCQDLIPPPSRPLSLFGNNVNSYISQSKFHSPIFTVETRRTFNKLYVSYDKSNEERVPPIHIPNDSRKCQKTAERTAVCTPGAKKHLYELYITLFTSFVISACLHVFPRSGRWKQAKREVRRDIRGGPTPPRRNTNPRNNRPITNGRAPAGKSTGHRTICNWSPNPRFHPCRSLKIRKNSSKFLACEVYRPASEIYRKMRY